MKKTNTKPARPVLKIYKLPPPPPDTTVCGCKILADDPMFIPQYKSPGAVCCDLVANIPPDGNGQRQVSIPFRGNCLIDCGFSMEMPEGWKAEIALRSGLGEKLWIVPNAPGQIDTDYRGRVMVRVGNLGREIAVIKHGDRIAQMWPAPVYRFEFEETDRLSETERGEGGFGSTGR